MTDLPNNIMLNASDADAGRRIDAWISERVESLSRNRVQGLIRLGAIRVNGEAVKANHRMSAGERIEIDLPPPRDPNPAPEPLPLNIVFEDDWLAVIDKPAGMTTHPAPGCHTGTLVNALLHHCRNLSGIGGVRRPGIVHRLDRNTSGLIIVAKSDQAHHALSDAIKRRAVSRHYLAVVAGQPRNAEGTVDVPIGRSTIDRTKMCVDYRNGRNAVTHWTVERWGVGLTVLRLRLETGRTHQIRVHLALKKMPIIGDRAYGLDRKQEILAVPHEESGLIQALSRVERQMLHATRLEFRHPADERELIFDSPPPADMQELINAIPPLPTHEDLERESMKRHG